jgi:hypothetical protein
MTSAEMKKLEQLRPGSRPIFEALIRAMLRRGYDVCIGTVWRPLDVQAAALASGHSTNKVGWHNFVRVDEHGKKVPASRAIDFRRRLPSGAMDTTTSGPEDFWRALYEEATALGLRSLAYRAGAPRWTKLLLNGRRGTRATSRIAATTRRSRRRCAPKRPSYSADREATRISPR